MATKSFTPKGASVQPIVHMPFDYFDCDKCGACCETLIVEAYDYDARREPKLYGIGNVDRQKLRDGESCVKLFDVATGACPFLERDKCCGIYNTRPVSCVMVEPGDAKCQQARLMKELPMLRDRDGNEPTREMLEASCKDYGLDICELSTWPPD